MATRVGISKEGVLPGSILISIHDFIARSPDELTLAKGDRIELIEKDDEFGDGWYLGRHLTNNSTGLFPEVYTAAAPRGTPTAAQQSNRESASRPSTAGATRPSNSPILSKQAAFPMAATGAKELGVQTSAHSSSPMISETLSVINEHMNTMRVPQPPFANEGRRESPTRSAGSVYSTEPSRRVSYIAGHETDEEDDAIVTEKDVMSWTPDQVAETLLERGVEKMHCDVFREQEITGEVLLAMDQSSLFIKEFDLGPVGRRLKTWQKVKTIQDEVRMNSTRKSMPSGRKTRSGSGVGLDGNTQRMSGLTGHQRGHSASQSQTSLYRPIADNDAANGVAFTSPSWNNRPESTYRPSAQNVRTMQHARRHSSIDSNAQPAENQLRHRKQPSIDHRWHMGQTLGGSGLDHKRTTSVESAMPNWEPGMSTLAISPDGYDLDGARRGTAGSISTLQSSRMGSVATQRGRFASAESIRPDDGQSWTSQIQAQNALTGRRAAGQVANSGIRSATAPTGRRSLLGDTQALPSPIVTRLDPDNDSPSMDAVAKSPTPTSGFTSSPLSSHIPFFGNKQKSKQQGARAISDAVTKKEKTTASIPSPVREKDIDSPTTGSTTPSFETGSIDNSKSEAVSRTSQGSGSLVVPPPVEQKRPRAKTKTKQATSAYTRGLEKKTPAEQMAGCDYSGWMKKKSGSLMTTWKPRLFILRGRRLSYYYADDDSEEKGLIDISFHRVLPAENETITGLHASLTGAATSPTSPRESLMPTAAERDLKRIPTEESEGLFIFKLVPPRTGLAKGVSFTKPTVHYFAVNSRSEGRLWMAALMKATIDRDDDAVVTTTYNQKTISLAKAQARQERPPALKNTDGGADDGDDGNANGIDDPGAGLGIDGLYDAVAGDQDGTYGVGGSERVEDTRPSTSQSADSVGLTPGEREAIALAAPS